MRLLLFVIAATVAATAHGEPMRCGNALISEDGSVAELIAKCGQPVEKKISTEDVIRPGKPGRAPLKTGTVTTEKWFYDRGSQAPRMVVTIVDGELKSVERERS